MSKVSSGILKASMVTKAQGTRVYQKMINYNELLHEGSVLAWARNWSFLWGKKVCFRKVCSMDFVKTVSNIVNK